MSPVEFFLVSLFLYGYRDPPTCPTLLLPVAYYYNCSNAILLLWTALELLPNIEVSRGALECYDACSPTYLVPHPTGAHVQHAEGCMQLCVWDNCTQAVGKEKNTQSPASRTVKEALSMQWAVLYIQDTTLM